MKSAQHIIAKQKPININKTIAKCITQAIIKNNTD